MDSISTPNDTHTLIQGSQPLWDLIQQWFEKHPELDALMQARVLNSIAHRSLEEQQRLKYEFISRLDDSIDKTHPPYPLKFLLQEIEQILAEYHQDYHHYRYFYGNLYQGFESLGIFGGRDTEKRFKEMNILHYLNPSTHLLDVACNCGFMALYASYRSGCIAEGFDWNPFMIRIGNAVNRYLGLEEKVHLHVADFNTFTPKQPYDVIFTLASYKTTDSGIENTIYDHLAQLHRWLAPQGIVVFESHHLGAETKDRLSPEQLGPVDRLYSWDDSHTIENGTREIFIFRKHAV